MKFLYLLVNEEESAVKIGVSNSPRNRALQLPVPIKLERSFEVEFREGSATSVERLLHYWFRDHKHPMPAGDGCTEWFRIDALPDIIRFLENERPRLGISGMRPLPARPLIDVSSVRITQVQSRADKIEARRIKEKVRAANYAKALAFSEVHNAREYERVQNIFRDLYAADIIAGIFPPNAEDQNSEGHLYLRGERRLSALNFLHEPRYFAVVGPACQAHLFTGSFYSPTCEFARVSVSREFLSEFFIPGREGRYPGWNRIRAYLNSVTCKKGSPAFESLSRIHRKVRALEARFCRDWREGWEQGLLSKEGS